MKHLTLSKNDLPNSRCLFFMLLLGMQFLFATQFSSAIRAQEIDAQLVDQQWLDSMADAKKKAAVQSKPIFVKFEANWCAPCQQLKTEFAKEEFSAISDEAILVTIDVDAHPEVADEYNISSIPAIVLIDANGGVVDTQTGYAELPHWLTWFATNLEFASRQLPDVLRSTEPPTRTEIVDLVEHLGEQDPTLRQLTIEKLASFPAETRAALVETLKLPGQLKRKLSILEILERWQAPVADLDPWVSPTFEVESLKTLETWLETPLEEVQQAIAELSQQNIIDANLEIDKLLKTRNVRGSLSRLTRYGPQLLPTVYERIKTAQTDQEQQRLTALRFWLTASNELRLGWAGGILELASPELDSRRAAVSVLVQRATDDDELLLLELFANADPLVRELSLQGLNRIGSSQTNQTMGRLLSDPDKNVRAAVLKQFAESESTEMSDEVALYIATETDADLIVQAIRFLRTCGGDEVMTSILGFVKHESWQVRAEVAEALGKVDDNDLSDEAKESRDAALLELVDDEDGFVVSRAAKGLPRDKSKTLIEKLFELADKSPDLGSELITEMVGDAYGTERKNKLWPFVKARLTSDQPQVRAVAMNGFVKMKPKLLTDDELLPFLEHEDTRVRRAGIDAASALFAYLKNNVSDDIESSTESNSRGGFRSSNGYTPRAPSRSPLARGFSWLFNSRPKALEGKNDAAPDDAAEDDAAKDDAAKDDVAQEDAAEAVATEPADEETPKADDKEPAEGDDESVAEEKPVAPLNLKREQWLEKWLAGEIETKIPKSIELIKAMQDPDDQQEQDSLVRCQTMMGNLEAFKKLIGTDEESAESLKNLTFVLPWQLPERRIENIQRLAEKPLKDSQVKYLFRAVAKVRNPKVFDVMVELPAVQALEADDQRRYLQSIYFGSGISYWRDYDPENGTIPQSVMDDFKARVDALLQDDSDERKMLGLVLIANVDLEMTTKVAGELLDSPSRELQDLALRYALKPKSKGEKQPDRTNGIVFLDPTAAWQPKEPWQLKTILRYLIKGEDALDKGTYFTDHLRIGSDNYYYNDRNSNSSKVKIPKPPKGLTLEMLELPTDAAAGADKNATDRAPEEAPDNDLELTAYRDYFQILLGEKAELASLVDWYQQEESEDAGRIFYQAVATLNADEMIPIVESVYENFGINDTKYAANLYWTIRVMDGKKALKLRKRIRKEVGMSQLKNY